MVMIAPFASESLCISQIFKTERHLHAPFPRMVISNVGAPKATAQATGLGLHITLMVCVKGAGSNAVVASTMM